MPTPSGGIGAYIADYIAFNIAGSFPGDAGIPGWVLPGAIIDEIFTTGQYYPRAIALELVDTRASSKTLTNASGVLSFVGNNVLPISNAGMLVEPAATNIIPTSVPPTLSNSTGGNWQAFQAATTAAAIAAPDLTTTGVAFIDDTTANAHVLFPSVNPTVVNGTPYAMSFFTKKNAQKIHQIGINSTMYANFDLNLGTSTAQGASATAIIAALTASWYRCTVRFTSPGTSIQAVFACLVNDVSAATYTPAYVGVPNGIYVWGAQLEAIAAPTSLPTSYIPSTSGAATRAADSITIQRTGIGRVVFTFDDDSTQTVSGINTGLQYTIPTNLNRPLIKRMTGYAA